MSLEFSITTVLANTALEISLKYSCTTVNCVFALILPRLSVVRGVKLSSRLSTTCVVMFVGKL